MKNLEFRRPTSYDAKIDLRSITFRYHLIDKVMGRAISAWPTNLLERIIFKISILFGRKIDIFLPGPLSTGKPSGAPLMSWFCLRQTRLGQLGLSDAIEHAFDNFHKQDTSSEVHRLIERVLRSYALDSMQRVPRCAPTLLETTCQQRILLIDEPLRSYSTSVSPRKRRELFVRMVEAAAAAHPAAQFWIARSTDDGCGEWLSSFAKILPPGTQSIGSEYSLCAAIDRVQHVYTLGASEGVQALLAGTPLHVFSNPYYSGWGLTIDYDKESPQKRALSPSIFFEIVFIRLARYLNPENHSVGTLDAALGNIELQRAVADRFRDLREVVGLRFQWWKRPFATPFLLSGGGSLRWTSEPDSVRSGELAIIWGGRSVGTLPFGARHARIEDGFLHSTGLGSDIIAPCSQVIDLQGIYFDSRRPNDLTKILNEEKFEPEILARACKLRADIVRFGLSKYNLGRREPAWIAPKGRRIALVLGQVADDASIRLGTRTISTADELLREVRERFPEVFIVYKPHPDVLSGNRKGLINAELLADVIDKQSDIVSLIDAADEVHTLSSLAGFDALLRGKSVFTYGLPFYAGWGLTRDAIEIPWRERHLTLDMLVAGVLLLYPIYWDWQLNRYTTPEAIVQQLAPLAARPLTRMSSRKLRFIFKAARWSRNAIFHLHWKLKSNH